MGLLERLRGQSVSTVPGLLSVLVEHTQPDVHYGLYVMSEGGVEEFHDHLKRMVLRAGWMPGKVFDEGDLIHPDLVEWEDMVDARREVAVTEKQVLESFYE